MRGKFIPEKDAISEEWIDKRVIKRDKNIFGDKMSHF